MTVIRERKTYAERDSRRAAEIVGLKEDLTILSQAGSSRNLQYGAAVELDENLVKLTLSEQEAETAFQKRTQAYHSTRSNHFAKVSDEQDVKYKQLKNVNSNKAARELTSDRNPVNAELSPVVQYLAKVSELCLSKVETHAGRDSRRADEVAGWKEALTIISQTGRSKNLQHGAAAGRPSAVGCLGQRRTGCRPWPGHGGHGPHSGHAMVVTKETCRLCSPAVGAVLRRCMPLAKGRYFYGPSQLLRSGGPWFCCSLARRSCVILPWSDPAFPQVIESDFSKDEGQAMMLVRRTQTSIGGSVRGGCRHIAT